MTCPAPLAPEAGTKPPVPEDGFVKTEYLSAASVLPLVIRPAAEGADLSGLTAWLRKNRDFVEAQLLRHGALLFRDFPIKTVDDFETVTAAASDHLLDYSERSSPRSQVSNKVYTSTDYPASQRIFPHNEHSYAITYPSKLFFCCLTPAQKGGETPLADIRRVTARISPELRERFLRKHWMYMRNFGDGFGLSWQTAFQTDEKEVVEEYCRKAKIGVEWKEGNRLRTRQVRPAFAAHWSTGETLWFNHATFFHVSTLDKIMRDVLTAEFEDQDLPNNTYYGDGSPIEPAAMEQLRAAYENEMVSFPWQQGDTILLDNMLTAHGRASFTGPRKILFAMAEPVTRADV